MTLGVLDYGAGNLRSVLNAFTAIGHKARLIAQPADFDGIDLLVFPGQGAFGDSVRILRKNELWSPLKAWLAAFPLRRRWRIYNCWNKRSGS